jgi:hypothetical protein
MTGALVAPDRPHRSVSQITSYGDCPMRFRLQRRDNVAELPAWWNVGGTAFHECIREWETINIEAGPQSPDAAAARFAHHLAQQTAATILASGVPLHEWRCGGRTSVAYPNKEDRSWWLDKGPEMVAQYVLAQAGREYEILRLDESTLAMELGFMWHLDDELPPLKGFVDQVLYFPRTEQIIVRDLKSGSHVPVDPLQLQVYRLAVESCFGITARTWWGDYWNARKGVATRGHDLTDRSKAETAVRYRLRAMDTAERLDLYPPHPGNGCSACGVRWFCPVMGDDPTASWDAPPRALLPMVDASLSTE